MKSRILLIDDSLTVQKVVSLTLDKSAYQVIFAKGRGEAVKCIVEHSPHLILLSDQVKDLTANTFPKEVETWLGRDHDLPAIVLITGQDVKEMRHFQAVLKKPFAPQALSEIAAKFARPAGPELSGNRGLDSTLGVINSLQAQEEYEDQRLEKAFNHRFNDEKTLAMETLGEVGMENDEPTLLNVFPPPSKKGETASELWGVGSHTKHPSEGNTLLNAEDSMAYKSTLENRVRQDLEGRDLDAVVDRLLNTILPPIVERLVQERLDKLLNDQEKLVEHS